MVLKRKVTTELLAFMTLLFLLSLYRCYSLLRLIPFLTLVIMFIPFPSISFQWYHLPTPHPPISHPATSHLPRSTPPRPLPLPPSSSHSSSSPPSSSPTSSSHSSSSHSSSFHSSSSHSSCYSDSGGALLAQECRRRAGQQEQGRQGTIFNHLKSS